MYELYPLLQEGPDASLSWLLWVVLGLFLLIVVIGWLVVRSRGGDPEVIETSEDMEETELVEETHVDKKPLDDLTKLEGIGPKVASILNEIGIASYADLANSDPDRIKQALDEAGLQMMDPEGWIEQAKLAAKGDMDGLKKLQDEQVGGRKSS